MTHEDLFPVVIHDRITKQDYVLKRKWQVCKRKGCPVCAEVIDACHDAASLYQLLLKLSPDSTLPPAEPIDIADVIASEEVGFALR